MRLCSRKISNYIFFEKKTCLPSFCNFFLNVSSRNAKKNVIHWPPLFFMHYNVKLSTVVSALWSNNNNLIWKFRLSLSIFNNTNYLQRQRQHTIQKSGWGSLVIWWALSAPLVGSRVNWSAKNWGGKKIVPLPLPPCLPSSGTSDLKLSVKIHLKVSI